MQDDILYINGRFLTQNITGVQRFAIEIVNRLIDLNVKFVLLCPHNILDKSLFEDYVTVVGKKSGYFWEQIELPKYLRKNKINNILNLCNLGPILRPGCCVIHDLSSIDCKKAYAFKYRFMFRLITDFNIKRYKMIYTVSNFSKSRLQKKYKIQDKRISVLSLGSEHFEKIKESSEAFPFLNKKFIFCLGSVNENKNMLYVLKCAKNHPELLFVVSGGKNKTFKNFDMSEYDKLDNVVFTGYVSDSELKLLYIKCFAFIFPSKYEGFGLPPLEAISAGCKRIILSNIEVFREIYSDGVNYINPYETSSFDLVINNLKEITSEYKDKLLKKYSWNNNYYKEGKLFSITYDLKKEVGK